MNGQEKEDALFNGAQSAEYWMYDARIGRRWNMDPVVKDEESPYACFSNNPIYFADPSGSNTVTPTAGKKGSDLKNGGVNGTIMNEPSSVDKAKMAGTPITPDHLNQTQITSVGSGGATATPEIINTNNSTPVSPQVGVFDLDAPATPAAKSNILFTASNFNTMNGWSTGITTLPNRLSYLDFENNAASIDMKIKKNGGSINSNGEADYSRGQFNTGGQIGWGPYSFSGSKTVNNYTYIIKDSKYLNLTWNCVDGYGGSPQPIRTISGTTIIRKITVNALIYMNYQKFETTQYPDGSSNTQSLLDSFDIKGKASHGIKNGVKNIEFGFDINIYSGNK
ncbi:MAG: hypothetical protein ABIP51_10275 [Bacteroidia bacterium]